MSDYKNKLWHGLKKAGIFGGIGLVIFLAVQLFLVPNEAMLIIQLHYSGYMTLIRTIVIGGGICFGLGISEFVWAIASYIKERPKRQDKEALVKASKKQEEEAKLNTPESIHDYLKSLLHQFASNSDMGRWLRSLISQLDAMNGMQASLERLFVVNDILKLNETRDLLQDIENAICMSSTKRLINYYIVGGHTLFLEHVAQTYEDNHRLLEQAQGMLNDIVEFINGGKTLDEVKQRTAVFRRTIQEFVKEDTKNEKQSQKNYSDVAVSGGGF